MGLGDCLEFRREESKGISRRDRRGSRRERQEGQVWIMKTETVVPEKDAVVERLVYDSAEEYDPVLRAHCRLDGKECVFPSAGGKRPGREV